MNLTSDPDCPPTVVADAEQAWPFPDKSFDVVVAGEILEHLFEDRAALAEARRVLRDDGALVATVPFLHDEPEYHVRVHTRESIRRLLENSGFAVSRIVERPGVPLKRALTVAVNVVNLTRRAVGAGTRFAAASERIGALELAFGERRSSLRNTLGALRLIPHGCTVLARKADTKSDYKALNEDAFGVEGR
jgi:SAM-dependent methyltransferase